MRGAAVFHDVSKHSPQREICVGADDFGLHAGVNQAILQLAERGRVNAIGCLVGAPAWVDGLAGLRRLDPTAVDVGLHLDLTEFAGLPRLRPGLVPLIVASYLRRLDRQALRAHIRLQLDAFEQALGRAPAFIDGHQHVHQLPQVREALLDELHCRGGQRPWLRSTHRAAGPWWGGRPWRQRAKAALIEALGAHGLSALARRHGYPQNRRLLGVYDFRADAPQYLGWLASWLASAGDADLLMCHPSGPAHCTDPLLPARRVEGEVLAGAGFAALLQSAGLSLAPMSRILARGAR